MIRITVSGRHMDVSETLKTYANDKAEKLERFYDRVQSVEVVFDRQSGSHLCEIIASADHHTQFVAKETHEDPYASLDASVKSLERQLTRHKERFRNRKHPEAGPEKGFLGDSQLDDVSESPTEGEHP